MLVNVRYSGKRLPWTIKMPWLSVPDVTFGESREAKMVQTDAERLCAENPTDWEIIGIVDGQPAEPAPVDAEPEVIAVDKPETPKNKKPSQPKKRKTANK